MATKSQHAPAYEPARNALMLGELHLPTIRRLWSEFAERSDVIDGLRRVV